MKNVFRVLIAAAALIASYASASADKPTTPSSSSTAGDEAAQAGNYVPSWHSKRVHIPEHLRSIGSVPDKAPHPEDGEEPPYVVPLPSFWADAYEVSNARFARFVKATGYVTTAEEEGFSVVHSSAGSHVQGGSLVASPGANTRVGLPDPHAALWLRVDGATWRHPEGEGDSTSPVNTSLAAGNGIVTRAKVTLPEESDPPLTTPGGALHGLWAHLPVVHVSAVDAAAFCEWDGGVLPTEEQWEAAARGQKQDRVYPWGDKQLPAGTHRANTWQGDFPSENTAADGFAHAAPISALGPQNTWGMFNAVGNVAEWTKTHWCNATAVALRAPADMLCTKALQGAIDAKTYRLDMTVPGSVVVKGGSFLSTPPHDDRARAASRRGLNEYTTSSDVGFRCVYADEWGRHSLEELSEGEDNSRFVPAMPTPVPASLRPHLDGEVDVFGRPKLQAEAAAARAAAEARAEAGGASANVGASGAVDWGNIADEVDPAAMKEGGWQRLEVLQDDGSRSTLAAAKEAATAKRTPPSAAGRKAPVDTAADMKAAAEARERMARQAREYHERTAERTAALEAAMDAAERAGVDIEGDDTMWNEPFDLHAHGTFDTEYVHDSRSDEELAEMTNKGDFGMHGQPPLGAQEGLGGFATGGAPGDVGAGAGAAAGGDDDGYDGDAVVDPDQYGGQVPQ